MAEPRCIPFSEYGKDKDIAGHTWPADYIVCSACGQPDSCGDCNHTPLSDTEAKIILGKIDPDIMRVIYRGAELDLTIMEYDPDDEGLEWLVWFPEGHEMHDPNGVWIGQHEITILQPAFHWRPDQNLT